MPGFFLFRKVSITNSFSEKEDIGTDKLRICIFYTLERKVAFMRANHLSGLTGYILNTSAGHKCVAYFSKSTIE